MADLTPITRKEMIASGEKIKPLTRKEYFVQNRKEDGGGGEGGGGESGGGAVGFIDAAGASPVTKTIDGHAFDSSTDSVIIQIGSSRTTYTSSQYVMVEDEISAPAFISGDLGGNTVYSPILMLAEQTASKPSALASGFLLAEGEKAYTATYLAPNAQGTGVEFAEIVLIPADAEIIYQ